MRLWMSGDGAIHLAGDRGVARDRDAVLHRLDPGGRDVGHDEAGTERAAEGLEPHHVGAQLVEPRFRRQVERFERLLAHDTIRAQAVARLEAPHRRFHIGVVGVVEADPPVEVAAGHQALAQRLHARMLHAEPQPLDRRDRRPAAPRDNSLVFGGGLLGGLGGRGRERRQRCLGHLRARRRGIEILPELALLVALDQLLQRVIVLGKRAAREPGAYHGCRAGEKTAAIEAGRRAGSRRLFMRSKAVSASSGNPY